MTCEAESRYTVNVSDRIKYLLGDEWLVMENETFEYRWSHGYETIEYDNGHGGGLSYAGAYHPNGGYCMAHEPGTHDGRCTHDGICVYCGRTLM